MDFASLSRQSPFSIIIDFQCWCSVCHDLFGTEESTFHDVFNESFAHTIITLQMKMISLNSLVVTLRSGDL